MKKRVIAAVLAVLMTVLCATGAFAATKPPYIARELTVEEVRAIMNGDTSGLLPAVYDALIADNPESVPSMKFAVQKSDPDYAATYEEYKDWIVHFGIRTNKDVDVILMGQFDAFGATPVVLPEPFHLKAGETFLIMDWFAKFWFGADKWTGTYKDIADLVEEFNCMAIPITDTLKNMLDQADAGIDLSGFSSMKKGTSLSIELWLYPPENAPTGSTDGPLKVDGEIFAPDGIPETGDGFTPVAWIALGGASLLAIVALNKKRCVR